MNLLQLFSEFEIVSSFILLSGSFLLFSLNAVYGFVFLLLVAIFFGLKETIIFNEWRRVTKR